MNILIIVIGITLSTSSTFVRASEHAELLPTYKDILNSAIKTAIESEHGAQAYQDYLRSLKTNLEKAKKQAIMLISVSLLTQNQMKALAWWTASKLANSFYQINDNIYIKKLAKELLKHAQKQSIGQKIKMKSKLQDAFKRYHKLISMKKTVQEELDKIIMKILTDDSLTPKDRSVLAEQFAFEQYIKNRPELFKKHKKKPIILDELDKLEKAKFSDIKKELLDQAEDKITQQIMEQEIKKPSAQPAQPILEKKTDEKKYNIVSKIVKQPELQGISALETLTNELFTQEEQELLAEYFATRKYKNQYITLPTQIDEIITFNDLTEFEKNLHLQKLNLIKKTLLAQATLATIKDKEEKEKKAEELAIELAIDSLSQKLDLTESEREELAKQYELKTAHPGFVQARDDIKRKLLTGADEITITRAFFKEEQALFKKAEKLLKRTKRKREELEKERSKS